MGGRQFCLIETIISIDAVHWAAVFVEQQQKMKEKNENLDRAKKLPKSRHKPEAMVEVKNGRIGGTKGEVENRRSHK